LGIAVQVPGLLPHPSQCGKVRSSTQVSVTTIPYFQAIDLFVNLPDDSDEVPDLRVKEYRTYT
jgi:hypothetical protein